jgi:hypothetical protein
VPNLSLSFGAYNQRRSGSAKTAAKKPPMKPAAKVIGVKRSGFVRTSLADGNIVLTR